MLTFYGRRGQPIGYMNAGDNHIFGFNGSALGYVMSTGQVYKFDGRFLGWFDQGWLYDEANAPALFSESASGGPIRPLRQLRPIRSIRQLKPMKSNRQLPPSRPIKQVRWSALADATYFD